MGSMIIQWLYGSQEWSRIRPRAWRETDPREHWEGCLYINKKDEREDLIGGSIEVSVCLARVSSRALCVFYFHLKLRCFTRVLRMYCNGYACLNQ